MITPDQILASAIRDETMMSRLGGVLRNDLVLANPHQRRIAEFTDDFVSKRRKLPADGDYAVWLETLAAGNVRDATREALGRLLMTAPLRGDAAYIGEALMAILREAAAQVAKARINQLPTVRPETFAEMSRRIESLTPRAVENEIDYPTLGQIISGAVPPEEAVGEAETLIPYLAWRGAHVLLVGDAKAGKSTLLGSGVVALVRNREFLGARAGVGEAATKPGRVLWLALDESRRDAYRLRTNGAFRSRVNIVLQCPNPGAFLREKIENPDTRPDLVIIDSLLAYMHRETSARGEPPISAGDAGGWARVIRPISDLAHEYDVGIDTIHHARRSDGEFRDSGEIAAAVDGLFTMRRGGRNDPPEVRRMKVLARQSIPCSNYAVRLERREESAPLPDDIDRTVLRDHYVLLGTGKDGGGPEEERAARDDLPARIVAYVEENAGCSRQDIKSGVRGRGKEITDALDELIAEGAVRAGRRKGKGGGSAHYAAGGSDAGAE
jgi:hypothetical protein